MIKMRCAPLLPFAFWPAEEDNGLSPRLLLLQAPPLCNFGGVACEGWRVSGLSLSGNDLQLASLPLELGRLASLRSLDLSRAGISGRLSPQLLEGLSNLEALSLASNNLTGAIPPELSALSSLRTLDLSNNTLQGTIPSSLGIPGLANLEFLDLSDNSLTGRLPGGFADMRALRSLDVSGNCGICGGPPAPAPGMTLEATLEVFNYTGTHLWMPCEVLSEMRRCPDGVANFEALHTSILTTILQVCGLLRAMENDAHALRDLADLSVINLCPPPLLLL